LKLQIATYYLMMSVKTMSSEPVSQTAVVSHHMELS